MAETEIPSVPKIWGEERWIANDGYCGKLLILKELYQCSIHYHKIKNETFFILKGSVLLEIDGKVYFLIPGDVIDVKAGEKHRFTGLENSEIIEFSSHHEDSDSYRDTESKEINSNEAMNLLAMITDNKDYKDRIKTISSYSERKKIVD